jgi:small subunit ribosomal protein S6
VRVYEALFVLNPLAGGQELEKLMNSIGDVIVKAGGKIESAENWGKRRLAYQVKKHREGIYYFVKFQIIPSAIGELERLYRLNSHVMKHLITLAQ